MSTRVRILLATVLAVACGTGTYFYLRSLQPAVPVWVSRQAVAPGTRLTAGLVEVRYVTPEARRLLPEALPAGAGDAPQDWTVLHRLEAGQALRRDVNVTRAEGTGASLRVVTLPAPPLVRPGQHIDVYATPRESAPHLLLSSVRVMDLLETETGLEAVVHLHPDQVQPVLAARRNGELDLVPRLPK